MTKIAPRILEVAAFALAATAWAGSQDFTLLNQTGLTLVAVYVSPSHVDDWQEDVLGEDVLRDGESVLVEFSPKEMAKTWDLKVVDEDGDETIWHGLRLDKISRVTLRYDKNGDPVADEE
jgi:hypothetical protein